MNAVTTSPLDRAHMVLREIQAAADLLATATVARTIDSLMPETLTTITIKLVDRCVELQAVLDEIPAA
jgi:hypothetical protein